MKFAKVLLMSLLIFPLLSCSKKEKDRLLTGSLPGTNGTTAFGTISLTTGGNTFSTPLFRSITASSESYDWPIRGTLTLDNVEISTDGTQWVSLLQTPLSVTIGPTFEDISVITIAANAPVGEYQGIRITLPANALAVQERRYGSSLTGVSWDAYPGYDIYPGINRYPGQGSQVTLTSSNNALTPFRVEVGVNTNLVLGISARPGVRGDDEDPASEWGLAIQAAAGRI